MNRNVERAVPAGLVIQVCIAKVLHERDPGFLDALKDTVEKDMKDRDGNAKETLQTFLNTLRNPEFFPR